MSTSNPWKTRFWMMFAFTVIAFFCALYAITNDGVKQYYSNLREEHLRDDMQVMSKVLPELAAGSSKADLLELIQKYNLVEEAEELSASQVQISGVIFNFNQRDQLVSVSRSADAR